MQWDSAHWLCITFISTKMKQSKKSEDNHNVDERRAGLGNTGLSSSHGMLMSSKNIQWNACCSEMFVVKYHLAVW